jgi:hypothetical protein
VELAVTLAVALPITEAALELLAVAVAAGGV